LPHPNRNFLLGYKRNFSLCCDSNAPEPFIANPEENCRGYGLKLSARANGAFTVTNSRNGYAKTYPAR
jgi:hypothetical protein